MATLTIEQILKTGLVVTPPHAAAAGGGDEFLNDGKDTFINVQNTDAAPVTVTIVVQATVDGQAVTSKTVVIPATTGDKFIGPFPTAWYNDGDSKVQLTYSDVTALFIAVFKL